MNAISISYKLIVNIGSYDEELGQTNARLG